jgi:hypothetical protein
VNQPTYLLAAGALVATVAGCDPLWNTPGEYGELGNGKFTYQCAGVSDAMCETTVGTPQDVAADLAVGSRFDLTFTANDFSSASVVSASSEHVSVEGTGFVVEKGGSCGFIARRGDRDLDVVHLVAREVEEIHFAVEVFSGFEGTHDNVSSIDLDLGIARLRALPWGGDGVGMLAGALGATWTSADPTIVALSGDLEDNVVDLEARAPGDTTITVKLGEHERSIPIHVNGEGGEGGSGGSGGEGGSNEGGSNEGGAGGGA